MLWGQAAVRSFASVREASSQRSRAIFSQISGIYARAAALPQQRVRRWFCYISQIS